MSKTYEAQINLEQLTGSLLYLLEQLNDDINSNKLNDEAKEGFSITATVVGIFLETHWENSDEILNYKMEFEKPEFRRDGMSAVTSLKK